MKRKEVADRENREIEVIEEIHRESDEIMVSRIFLPNWVEKFLPFLVTIHPMILIHLSLCMKGLQYLQYVNDEAICLISHSLLLDH